MSNIATRMRDKGRSWTEIAEMLGVSVFEAKAAVEADKRERRKALSETQVAEDRNGLRDKCVCEHERKQHLRKDGRCLMCSDDECDGFEQPQMFTDRWWYRRGVTPKYDRHGRRTHYEVEKIQLPPETVPYRRLASAAYQLGVAEHPKNTPEIPHPSLKVKVRRARKRLAAGKPVFKRTDRKIW